MKNILVESKNFIFNKNTHFFNLIEINLENDFKINDIIKINTNIFYEYDNITNDYHRLEHEYQIYADNILFFKKIIQHKQFYIDESIIMKEKFDIAIEDDFENLTVKLILHRINRSGIGHIVLNIPNDNDNFINIKYLSKTVDFSLMNENINKLDSNLTTHINDTKNINFSDISINKQNNSNQLKIIEELETKTSKSKYIINDIISHNIDLNREFEFIGDQREILVTHLEIDQREFSINDCIKFNTGITFIYENSKLNWYKTKLSLKIYYDDNTLIKELDKLLESKGFIHMNYIHFNIDDLFIIHKPTTKIIFKYFLKKTHEKINIEDFKISIINKYERNYLNIEFLKYIYDP